VNTKSNNPLFLNSKWNQSFLRIQLGRAGRLFMLLVLLLSFLGRVPIHVQAASGALLADSDFNASADTAALLANTLGVQDWYESRGSFGGAKPAALTLDENPVGTDSTKKAAIKMWDETSSSSGGAYLTQELSSAQSGTGTISFKINIHRILAYSTYNRTADVYIGNDSDPTGSCPTGADAERFVHLGFYDSDPGGAGSNLELRAESGSQDFATTSLWAPIVAGLSYDTWYPVKIDIDFANNNYDVSVDRGSGYELLGDNIAKNGGYTASSLSFISFASGGFSRGDFYVDDVTATFANVAPVAVNDTYSTAGNTALTVAAKGVLTNDTDANSDPLTAIKVSDPANGALALNADGSFTYTPTSGFLGDDTFTYKANDGIADSNVVTVTIHVTNDLLVDSDFEASADSAALRTNAAVQDWYESSGASGAATVLTLDQTNIAGNVTKKAAIKNYSGTVTSTNMAYLAQEFRSPQSGTFVVSFRLNINRVYNYTTAANQYDRTANVYIGDDHSTSTTYPMGTSDERFLHLAFYDLDGGDASQGSNLQLVARPPSTTVAYSATPSWTILATGLSYDTWYPIKLVVNVASGKYDVYLDSGSGYVLVGNQLSKYDNYISTSVTHISFTGDYQAKGDFYVDDVSARLPSTVTFNGNGADGGSMPPQTASVPTALTANAFTRTGYTFDHWNTAANNSGTSYANSADYSFAADTTLYAQWSINRYTVTFDSNDGTGSMTPQTENYNIWATLTPNTFTRTGYAFTGWDTLPGSGGTHYADGANYHFTASITLYAQWGAPGAFSKTSPGLDATGVATSETLTWGTSSGATSYEVCLPTSATALCDTFIPVGNVNSYPYSGLANGTKYYWQVRAVNDGGTTLANDGGIWYFTTEAQPRTVTFHGNGATSGSMDPQVANTPTNLTLNTFTRTGYSFNGWNTQPTGVGGTAYANGASYNFSADIDLYAQWTLLPPAAFSKLTPANAATGVSTSPTLTWQASSSGMPSAQAGSPKLAPVLIYEYCYDMTNDSACAGWTSVSESTSVRVTGLSKNTTYFWQVRAHNAAGDTYANNSTYWSFTTAEAPTVTTTAATGITTTDAVLNGNFNANDSDTTIMFDYGLTTSSYIRVTVNSYTLTGHTVTPYGVAVANLTPGTLYHFRAIGQNAGGTTYGDDLTFTTTAASHTVTFHGNSSTGGSMSAQSANTTTPLTSNAFTRTGYTFANWATQPGGGGTSYANNANYNFLADIDLYAQWTANTYTVTFDAQGGSTPDPISKVVMYDAAYGTLATTSRVDYTLNGWFTASSGGTQVTAATLVATASDHTLFAHWTQNTTTHEISLFSGWNLVSFDLHPVDTSIAAVLSSIDGKYNLVYAWDATGASSGSGNWLKYDPTGQAYQNSLHNLDEKMGFWIHMTAGGTLQVTGTVIVSSSIDLWDNVGGWNLVGYPSTAARLLPGALQQYNVGTDFSLVYAYHANDAAPQWKLFDREAQPYANDLTQLTPGWGYWIKVNADHSWSVNYLSD
jgi:uncharacterized repeat protein (TIGR02543 family)